MEDGEALPNEGTTQIFGKDEAKLEEASRKQITTFDPDSDGFEFTYEKASILHKNMNMLQFIRKNLLPNNCR